MGLQRLFHLLKLRQSRPDAAAATRARAVGCSEHGFLKSAFPFPLAPAGSLAIGGRGCSIILGRVEAKGVCLFAPPAGWFPVTRGDTQFPELSGSGRRDRHRK